MALSDYHLQFTLKSDSDIQRRIDEKELELKRVFEFVQLSTDSGVIRVAVLGCADKRLVRGHKKIFEKVLNKKVELTTFDLSVEHLLGEENVAQHDCTLPLPNTPYDITYAHVLLKFIPTEKQLDLIKNSFAALVSGGIAIHVLDKIDYETIGPKLPDGYFTVPLADYKLELTRLGIGFKEVPNRYGVALVLLKH
ncbi:MAG: hypothetical protein V1867_04115 [Candidatus Falkowbacteria bacterium]